MFSFSKPLDLPSKAKALLGRESEIPTALYHAIFSSPLKSDLQPHHQSIVFGMGCFWGAEKIFWQIEGVSNTAVGYAGGYTPNPLYEEVCSGRTGHTEVVKVDYDSSVVGTQQLLKYFWEEHDPTQGMRQGNDVGTQYRSAIFWTTVEQVTLIRDSRRDYSEALKAAGHPHKITTEVSALDKFYFAEDYHQQYLAKNPNGYCGIGGTGVTCPLNAKSPTG